nr:hypothetical protein Iba_scaffold7259CG0110 [Ipomoea batatas]
MKVAVAWRSPSLGRSPSLEKVAVAEKVAVGWSSHFTSRFLPRANCFLLILL